MPRKAANSKTLDRAYRRKEVLGRQFERLADKVNSYRRKAMSKRHLRHRVQLAKAIAAGSKRLRKLGAALHKAERAFFLAQDRRQKAIMRAVFSRSGRRRSRD